jgi:hypothetical protein
MSGDNPVWQARKYVMALLRWIGPSCQSLSVETKSELFREAFMVNGRFSDENTRIPTSELFESGIELYKGWLERTAEVQKHMLDAVAEQNAQTAELSRRIFQDVPGAEAWLNLAEQSMANLIDMQRQYLDFVEQQSAKTADFEKAQGERTARFAGESADAEIGDQGERKTA